MENHYFPWVPGIEALFGEPLFSLDANSIIERRIGFRRKASIIIEGPPGSGKTAATLALCRALMPSPAKSLYYLSTEMTKDRLITNHSEFGWFDSFRPDSKTSSMDEIFTRETVFFPDLPRGRTDRPLPNSADLINEIFRGLADDRRKPNRRDSKSLVIVDSLSGLIRDASTPGDRRRLTDDFLERLQAEFGDNLGLVFLITESTPRQSDEAPLEQYVADYVFRLGYKDIPGGRRLRTWEVVKSHGTYMETGEHTWDLFTAATSNRFHDEGLRAYIQEYRDRKGKASTQTPSNDKNNISAEAHNTVESVALTTHIAIGEPKVGFSDSLKQSATPSATIVIYPQWSTYLRSGSPIRKSSSREAEIENSQSDLVWSGTPGLDELLRGDTDYWGRPDLWSQIYTGAKWKPGLQPGETTLFLGESGTLKSWICLQFLAANLHSDGVFSRLDKTDPKVSRGLRYREEAVKRGDPKANKKRFGFFGPTLFLSFEDEPSVVDGLIRTSKDLKPVLDSAALIFASPASLHINRLLFELRWICRERRVERAAVDGLAELLKGLPADARVGVVTALLRAIQNACLPERESSSSIGSDEPKSDSKNLKRPTVFATYELAPHDADLPPESAGISAICDNVVVLQHIRLTDQSHKAVHVLKARGRSHDRQVRELVANPRDTGRTPGVRIQSGFEGYSDVLSGKPSETKVSLQMFHENDAERLNNIIVKDRLQLAFSFPVELREFCHSQLSKFLQDARGELGHVSSTDITVITLDEWWLRDLQRNPKRPASQQHAAEPQPSPLLRIDGFFARTQPDHNAAEILPVHQRRLMAANQSVASEHWITEVEKAVRTLSEKKVQTLNHQEERQSGQQANITEVVGKGRVDVELQAMPHYTDFSLFCINHKVAMEGNLVPKKAFESRLTLLDAIPSAWALPSRETSEKWFTLPTAAKKGKKEPAYQTIADLLFVATDHGKNPKRGFSFDIAGGESAVCFLMELCWSFGVEEGFLSQAAINRVQRNPGSIDQTAGSSQESRQAEALKASLRLLQYLVFHGLMVPYPTARGGDESLLSRQWYSTLNIDTIHDGIRKGSTKKGDTSKGPGDEAKAAGSEIQKSEDLIPVPFFPVGMLPEDHTTSRLVVEELLDLRKHLSGICHRLAAALEWIRTWRVEQVAKKSSLTKSFTASGHIDGSTQGLKDAIATVQRLQRQISALGPKSEERRAGFYDVSSGEEIPIDEDEHNRLNDFMGLHHSLEIPYRDESKETLADVVGKYIDVLNGISIQMFTCAQRPSSGLSGRQLRWTEWEREFKASAH